MASGLVLLDPSIDREDSKPDLSRSVSVPPAMPNYGRGNTPLWNTFESMLQLSDLSDTEEDDKKDNLAILYDDECLDDDASYIDEIHSKLAQELAAPAQISCAKSMGSNASQLPSHLNIDRDRIASKPKFCNSVSVPIRQMRHYQLTTITIWSDHEQDLDNLLQARRGRKNVKFRDVENKSQSKAPQDEKKDLRRYLMTEIIKTEESYVRGLNTLLYEFVIPMFDQKLIDLKHKETITCNIPEILMFHTEFLKQLVDATSDEKTKKTNTNTLVAVFYTLCNDAFVAMYTKYAETYQNMLDVYAKYKFNKSKKLQKYLKAKRTEKKPLTNHLILPIQRVTRYLLLLQALKKKTPSTHSEYKELECVLHKINQSVSEINERQREIECMSQCLQVQETMNGLKRNIVDPHRKLLAQYLFRKKENQRARQFFLFNDLLIITNVKFKVKALIEMRTMDIKQQEDSNVEFHLYSPDHEAVYETDQDKVEDLDDLLCLIEHNRSVIYQDTLRSVGASDIATLLEDTHSVSGSSLKKFLGATSPDSNL